jgi:predicted anti-sigma-YlaC factor YlaD
MRWPLTIPLYPCESVREKLYDAVEGSLAPLVSLRFRLHLKYCPPCREYLRLYRMAADMKSFRRDNPPPTDLMDKTLDFLERQGIAAPDPDGQSPTKPPEA